LHWYIKQKLKRNHSYVLACLVKWFLFPFLLNIGSDFDKSNYLIQCKYFFQICNCVDIYMYDKHVTLFSKNPWVLHTCVLRVDKQR